MNSPPTDRFGLSPKAFSTAFPFHLVVDHDMNLLQAGPGMRGLLPGLSVGDSFSHHFRIQRPEGPLTFEAIQHHTQSVFLLNAISVEGLVLKGQMVPIEEEHVIVFLGSPWVTTVEDVAQLGLSLKDFAVHDSISDYLFLIQTQTTSLADASRLSGELKELNRRLESRVEERTWELSSANEELNAQTNELARANELLNVELSERKRAEEEIRRLNQDLEQRVVERTGELRESEERFRQAQKMEAVGRLAGGVAHDFNNLLMVMRGYGELLLNRLDANDPLRRNAEEIQKAAERATALTQQLLAFSRKQVLQPKVLDLNAVVTEVEKLLRRLIGEDIELAAVLDLALGRVKADPGQMEQIILNLAVNARDAMPRGGRLTLKTANVTLDQAYAYARQHVGAAPGPYVLLAVSDTGIGMDAETRSHIFEPFFTTKGAGKGTGLGLSTVYGIVKQSGGTLWVESAPGRGTTFEIYLPLVEEVAAGGELHPALPAPTPGGTETILVVEDEMSVRKLAAEFLGSNGYTVLEAQDGGEALQVCEEHRAPIHLLLTDVVMPGMSGWELAERLAGARPEMKVTYMSGYTDDAIVQHGVLEEGTAFLQKPFSLDALARTVREVLEAGRGNNLSQ